MTVFDNTLLECNSTPTSLRRRGRPPSDR
ncbi:unnamed protein product, partial [Rotaria magnacalcarata]